MTVGVAGFNPTVAAARWAATDKEAVARAMLDLLKRQQAESIPPLELLELVRGILPQGFPLPDVRNMSRQQLAELGSKLAACTGNPRL